MVSYMVPHILPHVWISPICQGGTLSANQENKKDISYLIWHHLYFCPDGCLSRLQAKPRVRLVYYKNNCFAVQIWNKDPLYTKGPTFEKKRPLPGTQQGQTQNLGQQTKLSQKTRIQLLIAIYEWHWPKTVSFIHLTNFGPNPTNPKIYENPIQISDFSLWWE